MKIINPTNNELIVTIVGTTYEIPANGSITGVKPEHAIHWKSRIHNFIVVQEEPKIVPEVAKEEAVEEVKEITKKVTKK